MYCIIAVHDQGIFLGYSIIDRIKNLNDERRSLIESILVK